MLLLLAISALAAPPGAVVLELTAYGEDLKGPIVVDADALKASGMLLARGSEAMVGTKVLLTTSMKVVHGARKVPVQSGPSSLAAFDHNDDGYLDAADPTFAALALFVDANGDGKMQPKERRSLASLGVQWISRYGQVTFEDR